MNAAILALALALMLFVNVALYKPSDHEYVSESPTESSQMIPPMDDVAVELPPKPAVPYVPPVVKAESKPKAKAVKQRTIDVTATFYVSNCEGCSGITKTGDNVRKTIYVDGRRVIAVDPRVIPLRSIVRVTLADGQSFEAIASDIGGMIKGKRIDVLVASYDEAIRLGRQQATVTILKLGGR